MSNNAAKSPKNVSFYNVIKCEMKLLKSEDFDEFTFFEVCDFLLDYLGLQMRHLWIFKHYALQDVGF